ncbi:cupin domain-containing protein [Pseudoxanthomonas sp. F37]|jgi:predicted cupin superfamily sugar epimerase|uniref:cupin domain-containing protein n=1 Tax=Pseudoxanthomonas TaxID=83618 RepID=UPI001FCFA747|nr:MULTISPECIES: cupin domain-containing protein [Pseudoxanthomonas]UOV04735.1 cupin domain-containing protein [Pseudoxanthomonas mexicana]UOV09747.1 cupin domain-containing protein [Pseudoxanthomonas sp. F37]
MHPRADELIRTLQLAPHPEGGHFRRVYESAKRTEVNGIERPTLTAIKFLLPAGVTTRWHRVDATEVWDWSEGGALELSMFDPEQRTLTRVQLDTSARGGQANQVVPAGIWQSARSLGDYTLVDCSVSPGFSWQGFELMQSGSEVARTLRDAGGKVA